MQSASRGNNEQGIQTVDTPKQLLEHIHQLIAIEPKFKGVYEQVGTPSLRRNRGGFTELMRAMVGQQLSVAAANSIWGKLEATGLTSPQGIDNADDDELRANGLSRQKIRYIRSLVAHDINYEALQTQADATVISTLVAVTGIGKWTAEMYLLFSLGRADILAVDDLAIKEAAKVLFELETRPTPKQLQTLSLPWSPYRSAASLLLWAYYGELKNKVKVPL